ncbi:hypothetical protein KKF81_06845 [Candidatus Micrarchaeota archaeon]|nr:hypothetical protein [Candidatus Micrarchaeota archaeon]MBU1166647.1 hypothetical protein [Candidatus Micrarchaeota archaeon]MBU1886604.1 hypothetical protein [Candidatus Micrarchaeota archaeon]
MEDTIEICAGCGKMPRPLDRMNGYFLCSRCGCRATINVTADDYERVVTDLDSKFHNKVIKSVDEPQPSTTNLGFEVPPEYGVPSPKLVSVAKPKPVNITYVKPPIKPSKKTKKPVKKVKSKKTVKKTKPTKKVKSVKKIVKKKTVKKIMKPTKKKIKPAKKKPMKKAKKQRK